MGNAARHTLPGSHASEASVNATIQGEDLGDVTAIPPAVEESAPAPASARHLVSAPSIPIVADVAGRVARMSPKRKRFAMIAACALVALPVLVVGGRHAGLFGAVSESLEATLDDARECMRHRAWDAPEARNFKLVTDEALARWPDNKQLLELRREAAGLVLNDALARKYANDPVEAAHLAALALQFDPELTTAQHLAAELAADRAKEAAPVASASASPDRKNARPKNGVAMGDPPRVFQTPPGVQRPPQTSPAASTRPGGGTPPASTGPWL